MNNNKNYFNKKMTDNTTEQQYEYTKEDIKKSQLILSEVFRLFDNLTIHYDLLRSRIRMLLLLYFISFVLGVCFVAVEGQNAYLFFFGPLLFAFFINIFFLFFGGKELHGNSVPTGGYPYNSLVCEKWYIQHIAKQFLGLAIGYHEDATKIKSYIDKLILILKISYYLTLVALLLGVVLWLVFGMTWNITPLFL